MSTSSNIAMFCQYCDLLTVHADDVESKHRCGMCRECELTLYQPNRAKFEKGWVPNKREIKMHRKKINKRVTPILKNIDNYL